MGYQLIAGKTSPPRGSTSQSGRRNSSLGDHHTIGSDGCCRYSTRGGNQGAGGRDRPATFSANLTTRPLAYTGSTSAVPGSRRCINALQIRLEFGGPTHSTPSVRARISASEEKAASEPCDPRLSPYTSNRGRRP